ncbi:MAG TPA: hypothetical protein VJ834_01420 [Burkholderiales bacterium]|nr:hypothetical protein [Burkholderiales bacterium]
MPDYTLLPMKMILVTMKNLVSSKTYNMTQWDRGRSSGKRWPPIFDHAG